MAQRHSQKVAKSEGPMINQHMGGASHRFFPGGIVKLII